MYLLRNNIDIDKKVNTQTNLIIKILNAQTPWQVLGISSYPRPSDKDIRSAYIEIAKLIHPDKCKLLNSDDASKLLTIAYRDIIENKKVFRPYYSTSETSQSVPKTPDPPPKPSYKARRELRRQYVEKYKEYKLAKASEMIAFRKKLEYQNQIETTKLDLIDKTEGSRRNTLDRTRAAYMNMKIEARLNQLPAEKLIMLCKDIGCEPIIDDIRKWALQVDTNVERPYEINEKLCELIKSSRPLALRRKDAINVNHINKARDKDRHDLELENLYIRHTNIVLTTLDAQIIELEEEHLNMQNICNELAKELENLKKIMGNHENNHTGFKWVHKWF